MREGLLIAIYLLDRFPRRPPPQAIGAPGPRPRRPLCLCPPPLQVRIVLAPLGTSLESATQFSEDVRSRGGAAAASTCIRDGLDRPQYGNIARLWRCCCCMTASHRMHCLEHDLARWRPLSACRCSLSLTQNSCGGPATALPRRSRRAVAYSTDQGRKQGANVVIRTPRARNPAPRGHYSSRVSTPSLLDSDTLHRKYPLGLRACVPRARALLLARASHDHVVLAQHPSQLPHPPSSQSAPVRCAQTRPRASPVLSGGPAHTLTPRPVLHRLCRGHDPRRPAGFRGLHRTPCLPHSPLTHVRYDPVFTGLANVAAVPCA